MQLLTGFPGDAQSWLARPAFQLDAAADPEAGEVGHIFLVIALNPSAHALQVLSRHIKA